MNLDIKRDDFDPASNLDFIEYSKNVPMRYPKYNKWTNWYDYIRVQSTHASPPDARGYIDLPQVVTIDKYATYKEITDRDRAITLAAIRTNVVLPKIDINGNLILDEEGNRIYENMPFSEIVRYPRVFQSQYLQRLNELINTVQYSDPKYRKMAEILQRQITGLQPTTTILPALQKKNQ